MKKILIAVILFFVSGSSLFAQDYININTDNYNEGDTIIIGNHILTVRKSGWISRYGYERRICNITINETLCQYYPTPQYGISIFGINDNQYTPHEIELDRENPENPTTFSIGEDNATIQFSQPLPQGITFDTNTSNLSFDTPRLETGKHILQYKICKAPQLYDILFQNHGSISDASSSQIIPEPI